MNLAGDGHLDGRITIKNGQGISQAIAGELGLNENDCKKLGSVWNEILQSAEKEDAFAEGSKKYEENMTVETGDVFIFNKNIFNEIIKKVNEKTIDLEVAKGVVIEVAKNAVAGVEQ